MTPELGMIEGRYGTAWRWEERATVLRTLASAGYGFYHYGPKSDPYLRRRWTERHPPAEEAALAAFAAECRSLGMRFGMTLTPVSATYPFDADVRASLAARIAMFDAIGCDDLCILFDDLRGDLPDLARTQAEIVDFCANAGQASRLYFCPTYYSDDPILDQVFGARPETYLAELGARLDPAVRVYWTGEEVCSREILPGHLKSVAQALGRPVALWDNYPVNDGPRMSRFLHLRAFTGRPAAIAPLITAHAINPAIQPHLSCLPALTLAASYAQGEDYAYGRAFMAAATTLFGETLATMLRDDLIPLQDTGHERLGEKHEALRVRYAAVDHPAAREVVRWLDGADLMSAEEVRTQ